MNYDPGAPPPADDVRYLRRLRANPDKIRVSIRRVQSNFHGATFPVWLATVEQRDRGVVVDAEHGSVEKAIEAALKKARDNYFDGIDLGCQWTYRSWPEPEEQQAEEEEPEREADDYWIAAGYK